MNFFFHKLALIVNAINEAMVHLIGSCAKMKEHELLALTFAALPCPGEKYVCVSYSNEP